GIRLLTGYLTPQQLDPFEDPHQRHQVWHRLKVTVSPELTQIFDNLLHPDIHQRYPSAIEVWQALSPQGSRLGLSSNPSVLCPLPPVVMSNTTLTTALSSDVGANFTDLQELLTRQNYAAADEETWNLLLKITHLAAAGALTLQAMRQFPTQDLQTLDLLWTELSGGHFGFSVQKQIYQRLGGGRNLDYAVWQTFGKQVGWFAEGEWQHYADLKFAQNAPIGHLPACFVDPMNRQGFDRGVCGWWRLGFVSLIQRLESITNTGSDDADFEG
ncbi:MAG: serine/threonine protein kinase, partial [Acaryochloris sp. SU_5_25]|nr:serine/threonine protein kinase [Acaryochloris sp. SU_5_25]